LGLLLVVGIIWGGLFAGFTRLTAPVSQPETNPTVLAAAVVTETLTRRPTNTPTQIPTETPRPPTTTSTIAMPEATDAPTSTSTPTPSLAPTDTPIPSTATPLPVEEEPVQISFSSDVLPIFEQRCFRCHGGEEVNNGFSVENYETVMKGSWNGTVVEPGDTEGSYLFNLVTAGDMPKRGPRLLPTEIETIRAWIEAGVPNN